VRTNRTVYPEGWELIEPTLRELESKMREGAFSSLSLFLSLSQRLDTTFLPQQLTSHMRGVRFFGSSVSCKELL
jgi:hypothetical protein